MRLYRVTAINSSGKQVERVAIGDDVSFDFSPQTVTVQQIPKPLSYERVTWDVSTKNYVEGLEDLIEQQQALIERLHEEIRECPHRVPTGGMYSTGVADVPQIWLGKHWRNRC